MIYPKKLKRGSHIRVIAPARSLSIIADDCRSIAKKRLEDLGFVVSYSKHAEEVDDFLSSSIESRVADIHEAFSDDSVDALMTVVGGFNTNQLIDMLDYKLIKANPKILCGFSDITCLAHAITVKTNIVTYSGPHFSSFGMQKGFDYTLNYFKKCLMQDEPYEIEPSLEFSDDLWFLDQENRTFIKNDKFWILNEGINKKITGKLFGGHTRCISSLQGTEFWPVLDNSILLLEEDEEVSPQIFDRMLQSLIHQKDFKGVKAILIGRFQNGTKMTKDLLLQIIKSKKALKEIPVIGNIDCAHTTPLLSYPIGGTIEIDLNQNEVKIKILEH